MINPRLARNRMIAFGIVICFWLALFGMMQMEAVTRMYDIQPVEAIGR